MPDKRRPRLYETILLDATTNQEIRRFYYKRDHRLDESLHEMGMHYRITAIHHTIEERDMSIMRGEAVSKADCEVTRLYLERQGIIDNSSFLGVTLNGDP
jgi:hypothetical protein